MNATLHALSHKSAVALAIAAVAALGGSLDAFAAPLNLSRVPLYTNESVEPNFVLTFDDSGSMLRGFVPDALSNASAVVPGYDADGDGVFEAVDTRCWWRDRPWLAYSAQVNKIYYDPTIVYAPPAKADGTQMPDASFTAAWEDGIQNHMGLATSNNIPGGTTTRNLSTDYRILWEIGFSTTYTGIGQYRPGIIRYRATNSTACEPDEGATADEIGFLAYPTGAAKAFYYQLIANPDMSLANPLFAKDNYEFVDVTTASAAQKTNFANWYSYYRTRSLLARSALSRVFDSQQNLRVAWQGLNANQLNNDDVIGSISGGSTQRTQLFDFLFRNPAIGGTPNVAATQRVGTYFGGGNNSNNDLNTTNPYYDATANRELSCRQNFHLLVTDGSWNTSGFGSNTDAATITLPDSKTYPASPHTTIYTRGHNNNGGLADAGMYYWATDLRPNLANNVPAHYEDLTMGVTGAAAVLGADELPSTKPEIYWNPVNDPATWQHLVQYIVGFGIGGNLQFPAAYTDLRTGAHPTGWPTWGAIGDDVGGKVDDSWHAAINGRGEFFSVSDPQELVDSLTKVFLSVSKRTSSNTPVSLSSGLLTSNTLGYQTLFDTSDWSGRVLASVLATNPDRPEWDAACVLTGGACPSVPTAGSLPGTPANQRKIATRHSGTGVGIPFQFSSLSSAQQTALNTHPVTGLNDGFGSQRLAYIRGDRSTELQNGGRFRNRKNLLGAVVNSAALVPRVLENYSDELSFEPLSAERANPYSTFSATLANYGTLFFGANDGMLHAVNSGPAVPPPPGSDSPGGTERWAYIPSTVFNNLNKLTNQQALQFESYVDASPQIRDVFINGGWRRVLIGGLRLGGQGVYALDVTNPRATSEGDVAAKVLWEFSDRTNAASANLGFTYGSPFVTRLANGEWVALVPGGYNSEVADGAAGDGTAHLFVLRVRDGAILKDFALGATSRGLSSVVAGDYRAVGDNPLFSVSDVAFAGDLNGNIWRFNLEGTTAASWTAVKFFTAAANQAITVQPRIARTAYQDSGTVRRKYVVAFGTGKYIENVDRSTTFQQSYYGLFDQGPVSSDYPLNQSKLQQQTLSTVGAVRRLSTTQVPASKRGWFFNFLASGERNISQAVLRNVSGTLIFTTLAPLSTDPCAPAAESYLMFVDASSGGVPGTAAAGVDTNNDGVADSTDLGQLSPAFDSNRDGKITNADDKLAVGLKLDGYIAGVTPISGVGGGSAQIIIPGDGSGGTGSTGSTIEIANYEWRRRSWRELITQ
jgi:type IV pilus assembly protein PilY1